MENEIETLKDELRAEGIGPDEALQAIKTRLAPIYKFKDECLERSLERAAKPRKPTRLDRFFCWLWMNHESEEIGKLHNGKTLYECVKCGRRVEFYAEA